MDTNNELFAALAKAQGQFKTVAASRHVTIKMKEGGSYSYNYATLASIMDMLRTPLSANGLSLVQLIAGDQLITILGHSSGQSVSSQVALPKTSDIKGLGANLTYLRRYCITAIVGVAIDEEDDESVAEGKIEIKQSFAKQNLPSSPKSAAPPLQEIPHNPQPIAPPGDIPDNPQTLTDAVNTALGQKYFNTPAHVYNALGKNPWPKPADLSSWADVYHAAVEYAKEKLVAAGE